MKSTSKMTKLAFALLLGLTIAAFTGQALAQGGTWITKAPMPQVKNYGGGGVVGGRFYAVGGWTDSSGETKTVFVYDPATDSWITKAPTQTSGGLQVKVGVVNGFLYAVGGGFGGIPTRAVEAYDPATDTWSPRASVPAIRRDAALGVVDGILYVAGGYNGDSIQFHFNTLYAFNPATNNWTQKASMPTSRWGAAAVGFQGKLYVMGGTQYDAHGTPHIPLNTVEVYDPSTDSWATGPPMLGGLWLGAAVANDSLIYVLGSDPWFELYNPVTNTWMAGPTPPNPRFKLAAGMIDGVVYAVGGEGPGGGEYRDINEAFTPTLANRPPVANAGLDKTQECANPAGTLVTLDGSATDPDGDSLTYTWTGPFPEGGGTVTGVSPAVTLPLGESTVTLVVNDGTVDSSPDTVKIDIQVFVSGLQPPMVGLSPDGVSPLLPTKAFKRGSTIPLKLQLFCAGIVCTNAIMPPPRIVGLFASGEEIDLETVDINAGAANDNGVLFRFSDPSWVYNLSTQGLNAGTYTITILMPDGRRFNAGFVLR